MTLGELIKEAKAGSVAAQQCLFDQLSPRMNMLCRRYLKNQEDAEERMLDGFYKFFKSIPSFHYQVDEALFAWLKKTMINECLMQLRKKNGLSIVSEMMAGDIPFEEDILDNLSAAEIFHSIIQLPVGYRTVFNLFAVEGYDHKEISKLLGISEGTSKSQLSKAKNLLQKILSSNGTVYAKQHSK